MPYNIVITLYNMVSDYDNVEGLNIQGSHSAVLGMKPIYKRLDNMPQRLCKLSNLLDSGRNSKNFHDAAREKEPLWKRANAEGKVYID